MFTGLGEGLKFCVGLTENEFKLLVSFISQTFWTKFVNGLEPLDISKRISIRDCETRSGMDRVGFCLKDSAVCGRWRYFSEEASLKVHWRTRVIVACKCSSVTSVDDDRVRCLGVSFLLSDSSTCNC